MADKVKVVGYAQRVFYDNGIEYRNFSDGLVGNQTTSPNQALQFTSGNFVITSTIDRKPSKIFLTKKYGPFMCLDDLKADQERAMIIEDNFTNVRLNLDKSNLCYHAYFGSLVEFIRVSLEHVIINWPASIWIRPISNATSVTGYTANNISYDILNNETTFTVDVERVTNRFDINHKTNGTIINSYNETNDMRNLTVNYGNYVIHNDYGEFEVLEFTGNTNDTNDYMTFVVKGDAFSGVSSTTMNYHVKPNEGKREEFFANLPDFESYLLNRFTTPQYKSSFSFNAESDTGAIYRTKREFVWPTTDGYNIDFDTTDYVNFVTGLIEMGEQSDLTKTNLMVRFLTSESISDFDTLPRCDGDIEETAGQKMNRTLKIYGREYDEIKKFIDGIAFANRVTYDKKDNTPDVYLKNIARVMGWELVSSVLDNDLLNSFLTPKDSSYSGHSRGYTPYEAEVELWRRIILNTPWIWKSKGTRKSIEFFLNFIGTPDGLITFNEYIYRAKAPIDMDNFRQILLELFENNSIGGLNVDFDGFPRVNEDTPEMYFQKAGLWYRETAGPNSNIDILVGNNPHVGPYDGGQEYIDQFRCLIPGFSAVTLFNETITTGTTNIFTNYNSGLVNNALESEVYLDIVNTDNVSLSACYEIVGEIIEDPKPITELTDCGCETGEGDEAIKISIKKLDGDISTTPTPVDCGYTGFTLDAGGYVQFQLPNGKVTLTSTQECCEALGFTYQQGNDISCWWNTTVTSDSTLCKGWEPVIIFDTGLVGWSNSELQISNTYVGSAECCEAYGYVAVQVDGGFECYDNPTFTCSDYTPYQSNATTGVVTFIDPFGNTTTQMSPECCEFFGLKAQQSKTGYECVGGTTEGDGTLEPAPASNIKLRGTKI